MADRSKDKGTLFELVVAAILTAIMTLAVFDMLTTKPDSRLNNSITDIKTERAEPGELP